ncbi:hypothetical protein Ahy_A07g035380 [Arachis hypogaea]|uniref:Aminotransferase-like plant mobile domain-containing protein n=1 Tax=Arachis hypogaea TaxID=3818 RepID=A0A445CDS0_ARAHY|nr:hypothetical protein Ahy_A07g035380 [Arachis hypogaea]
MLGEDYHYTLHDVAYQLGLRINGDRSCEWMHRWLGALLGVIPGPNDRQSQTKWTVKLTWFHNTSWNRMPRGVPDEVHERVHHVADRGILFPDASDSRVHIRWLPLLEDLETCGHHRG